MRGRAARTAAPAGHPMNASPGFGWVVFGGVFAAVWLIGLVSGGVPVGGSVFRPWIVRRRDNPLLYGAVMVLLATLAALCVVKGLERGL
ncbi:hypothetical protein [Caulobacter sp. 17J80-11]|uniref:hypothetical protein n=1 Tax=Caulobacter sp. 17J80-11 TaxID=2763502 RepID=UPI001653CD5F|nr:hypothetical protein [Caulobacter sp. 17J80-11]MBC6981355.1 hypothetical protein [Caulobacter sp. 17J80-11]